MYWFQVVCIAGGRRKEGRWGMKGRKAGRGHGCGGRYNGHDEIGKNYSATSKEES